MLALGRHNVVVGRFHHGNLEIGPDGARRAGLVLERLAQHGGLAAPALPRGGNAGCAGRWPAPCASLDRQTGKQTNLCQVRASHVCSRHPHVVGALCRGRAGPLAASRLRCAAHAVATRAMTSLPAAVLPLFCRSSAAAVDEARQKSGGRSRKLQVNKAPCCCGPSPPAAPSRVLPPPPLLLLLLPPPPQTPPRSRFARKVRARSRSATFPPIFHALTPAAQPPEGPPRQRSGWPEDAQRSG